MDRSPGFGPCAHRLLPSSDSVSLRVLGSFLFPSPGRAARRTVLQKVRGHTSTSSAPAGRRHRVSGSLSLPSRGPFHLSLTVLVAIGHCQVFSLGRWSSRLHAGFLVSRATPDPAVPSAFSCTGLSPSSAGFPKTVPLKRPFSCAVLTPVCKHTGLGSSAFARRYLRNRCFFPFLRVLRCFSSPAYLLHVMYWRTDT